MFDIPKLSFDLLNTLGIGLDLVGFLYLAIVLLRDQRRLAVAKTRIELVQPTRFIWGQYIGPEELNASLANEHLKSWRDKGHAETKFQENHEALFDSILEIDFPRFLSDFSKVKEDIKRPVTESETKSAKQIFEDFLKSFDQFEAYRVKFDKPNKGLLIAIFLILAGFSFQLVSSISDFY